MERRNFLKWLGVAPVLATVGAKIPWPKADAMSFKANSRDLIAKNYDVAVGKIYGPPVKFDPENHGVIFYESK